MGLMSRSVSVLRFRVKGEVEGSFWETVDNAIRAGAFSEKLAVGDEVARGWTSIEDFTDSSFKGASYVRGSYVALSLRIDTVRVPAKVLEMEVKKEARRVMEESGSKRLSSAQLRSLKESVGESLKRRVLPSIQVFDLIWDTGKGLVYFGTHSPKAMERLLDHFKKCFGLILMPVIPFLLAEELLAGRPEAAGLQDLKPCIMVP